ncbi:MAG: hypothetical protein JWR15_3796 [Prosthecobacter sp.]|nr:hypothetical protein [Prosthecobacter sp.]
MSTIDLAVQRLAGLDEQLASKLLAWLDSQQASQTAAPQERPLGAREMIGFAVQSERAPRATAHWMKELREGDVD